jgi:predicted phage baseplate assembly protein
MSGCGGGVSGNHTDCGCCDSISIETPSRVYNRPGLTALAYRVGTHAQFKQTLQARLSGADRRSLHGLNTRQADDLTVALLDAWATVADVLTFYQERIANEAYLRTATERVSLVELARSIGYELRPGVAANVFLVFTLEDAPGATRQTATSLGVPRSTTIDAGVKVQSIPGPGEQAQTFETVEKIHARTEWNVMAPRLTRRHPIERGGNTLFFAGVATGLAKGDGLLITPDDGSGMVFRQVTEVVTNDARHRTEVQLQPLESVSPAVAAPLTAVFTAMPGPITRKFLTTTVNTAALHAAAMTQNFEVADIFDNLHAIKPPPPSVLVLRTRAAIFGHNAPRFAALSISQTVGESVQTLTGPVFREGPFLDRDEKWADNTLDKYPNPHGDHPPGTTNIYLDGTYQGLVKGSRVVLKDGVHAKPYTVTGVAEVSRSDFTMTSKVTRLTLDTNEGFANFHIRGTSVFAQSEELALARLPIAEPVSGQAIDLDTFVDGLVAGQRIMVCGELDEVRGVEACEVATIEKVDQVLVADGFSRIMLTGPLGNAYVRATLKIHANVALATHGETVTGAPGAIGEVLGSGDASQVMQRFPLRQPPLTYTSAATASGVQSTLEVRVNELRWHEVASLYGHRPEERIYVTRTDDDGRTTVIFGDGSTGARLPTGQENVTARYRKGIGRPGLVKANQLSQLMTRPLGVKGVTNPMAPAGAADPEHLADARRNAPLTVLTLDRIVSLQDYEDFARAFAGIGKALATWMWSGEKRVVFVTVAGPGGLQISPDSALYQNLLSAMRAAGDPAVPLLIEPFVAGLLRIDAAVKVDADYLQDKVLAAVEQKLRQRFSFEEREFGQPASLSEAVAAMHSVPGVMAVDVNAFYRGDTVALNARIGASAPRAESGTLLAAELLTLDPRPLSLGVM